jgi:uncharacterized protein YqgV (UPF0045/DUF77 family)
MGESRGGRGFSYVSFVYVDVTYALRERSLAYRVTPSARTVKGMDIEEIMVGLPGSVGI